MLLRLIHNCKFHIFFWPRVCFITPQIQKSASSWGLTPDPTGELTMLPCPEPLLAGGRGQLHPFSACGAYHCPFCARSGQVPSVLSKVSTCVLWRSVFSTRGVPGSRCWWLVDYFTCFVSLYKRYYRQLHFKMHWTNGLSRKQTRVRVPVVWCIIKCNTISITSDTLECIGLMG